MESSEACSRELARIDVGDLGHSCIDAVHVLSFHNQHRLGRVKMELDTHTDTNAFWKVWFMLQLKESRE